MMFLTMKYLLLNLITIVSCDNSQKKLYQDHRSDKKAYLINCQEGNIIFPESKDLNNLLNNQGDRIPFSFSYNKDTCYVLKNIKFYKIDIILKSKKYLTHIYVLE